jgi:GntR family transcriptional regulator
MSFRIDPTSTKPVFLQLVDEIKGAVARGALRPGDRLPTIRDCSIACRLNRNTVAKAYAELERAGVVTARPGVGTVIAEPADRGLTLRVRTERLESALDEALAQARLDGLTQPQMEEVFQRCLQRVWPASPPEAPSKPPGPAPLQGSGPQTES